MDPILFALSQASLELSLLHLELLERVNDPNVPKPERDTIAFQLPIVAQKKRDLDRLFSAIHAQDGTVPLPSNATIASLTAATRTLADAVAADRETAALINLAVGLGGIVGQIKSA
jgi:hypothetical protein